MLTVLIINLIAVLFAYLARYRNIKYGLEVSFLILTVFLAIRYDYGNDYKAYLGIFKYLNSDSTITLFDNSEHVELGWIFLCQLFNSIGFFWMVIALTIFQCFVYYWMIKRYVCKKWYWFAVFIYVFSAGFMLTQLSMMRQSLAMSIFILAIPLIYRKKIVLPALLVMLASLFHTSALACLPLILIGWINFRIDNKMMWTILGLFLFLCVANSFIQTQMGEFITAYFMRYETYFDDEPIKLGTGIGFIYQFFQMILLCYYDKYQNGENRIFFKLSILSFMFIPLAFIFPLIGRIGMYMGVFTIISYPLLLVSVKNNLHRSVLLAFFCMFILYGFFSFFQSDVWKDAFGTYQTIFSAPENM